MNAPILAMSADDAPRLYSKPIRAPEDVVAEQHHPIHAELVAWGRWCREKYRPGECESYEHNFDPSAGRTTKAPTVALPENPRHRNIDRVVRHMRMWMPAHGEALRMYYVGSMRRDRRLGIQYDPCSPKTICHVLRLRYENFSPFMTIARAAVLNLLRRAGKE